jgi:hypothetical protein
MPVPRCRIIGLLDRVRVEKINHGQGREDFERHALAVLQRELGLDGLARFLRVYRAGTGDYTRDRHRWLDGATVEDVMAEVKRRDRPPS